MAKFFTVKVDLSEIKNNDPGRNVYISLVDQNKMRRVSDFKNWIRFLFSIEKPIDIMYEDAIVHDLEDTIIFSLLKTVRVKESSANEADHQTLHQRLDDYDKCQEEIPTKTMTSVPNSKYVEGNRINQFCSTLEAQNTIRGGDNKITDNKQSGPVMMNHLSHDAKGEMSVSWNENMSVKEENNFIRVEDALKNKSMAHAENQTINLELYSDKKQNDLMEPNYFSTQHNNKISASSKEVDETNSVRTNIKRKAHQRPFSLFDTLNMLRTENNKDEKKAEWTSTSVDSCEMSDRVNFICGDIENSQGRKRKRIRKHKSKRKNIDSQLNNSVPTPDTSYTLFSNGSLLSASPQDSVKPKHIRFETEEILEQVNHNGVQSGNHSDQLPCQQNGENSIMETNSNVIEAEIKSLDECHQVLQSCQIDKCLTNSEVGNKTGVANDHGRQELNTMRLGNDSPLSVLDALGSLRKQFASPLVVNRFK